jgi:diguanylate cyclase (GGDEF)-like protein
MNQRLISPRFLTGSYVAALVVIAGLSIVSHVLLERGLHSDQGSAAIVNLAGRQRMLSQRIAGLAAQYRMGDQSARPELLSAIDTFQTAHRSLAEAGLKDSLSAASERQLQAIYFGGSGGLDARVRSFLADARRVAALRSDDPALTPLLARLFAQARAPLLGALDAVVTIHQRESEHRLNGLVQLQWAILATVIFTLAVEALWIFRPMINGIVAYTSELLHIATIDGLTGTLNRRSFLERCEAELERARRDRRPSSLLMLDADRFKTINDTWGHGAGDEVLKAIGRVLTRAARKGDVCGRLGGEEFAMLMVETAPEAAAARAESLRAEFEALTVSYLDHQIRFTVSVGVAPLMTQGAGLHDTLRRADELMYRAKQSGRNRVLSDAAALGPA